MNTDEYQEAWSREMHSVPTTHVAGTGTVRQRCLETALKYTQQDRNKAHGDPENNFSNIARFWNAHLRARHDALPAGFELDATDVAIMMAGMKMARLSFNPSHEDSWIDLAGYAACGMEIALGE